jgi:MFS family permease
MILPATQSILNANFRGHERAIAFGIWGSVIGGVAAVGPLIGGWLTTYLSWRWAFYINIPIGIVAVLGTLRYIRESRDPSARLGFDPFGFILITCGLGAMVFGLIEGYAYGWWTPVKPFAVLSWTWPVGSVSIIPFTIAGGVVAMLLFAVVEVRRKRAGRFFLFDFDLWRYRAFRYGNLAGTTVSLGEFGLLFVLPLFLQAVVGYNAFETGLVFLSLAVGSFFAAPFAVALTRRYGGRRGVTLGMALEAVGILWTTLLISTAVTGLQLLVPLFVYGVGVGFATAQLTSIVLSDVPIRESGQASGTNSTVRQVGSAMGIAILGTVLFTSLGNGVHDRFAQIPAAQGVPPAVTTILRDGLASAIDGSAGQALVTLRKDPAALASDGRLPAAAAAFLASPSAGAVLAPYVSAADDAFVAAARSAGFVAETFVLLGLLFSFLLPVPVGAQGEAGPVPGDPEEEPI